MTKKQSAVIDFLMIYGWAILVVLIVIGAMAYLGVFDSLKGTDESHGQMLSGLPSDHIKTQSEWIYYYNDKGMKMISMPDIYQIAKQGSNEDIALLKQDFTVWYEITSTRIVYDTNSLYATIIHDAESTVVTPKEIRVFVPEMDWNFKHNKETEEFLQALFDTDDKLDTILSNLKNIYGDKTMWIWTPSQSYRASDPVRVVGFDFGGRGFILGCEGGPDDGGISRGVLSDSAQRSNEAIFYDLA